MEELSTVCEEVVSPMEESVMDIMSEKELPKKQKNNLKNVFKEKKCKILHYNKNTNTLDVLFDGFGIRIKDVKDNYSDFVFVKYKGEIGQANFQYKL